ncbi:MAG: hypothetical protein J6K32_05305 [Clostridia bacterium]|nr:hypothetical protein [Clostridia bacterium]
MNRTVPSQDSQLVRLLRADFYHLFRSKWLWLSVLAMLGLSFGFVSMQYSGMDYVVMLDRVVFLPLSFYGVVAAAMISLFVGEDFSDGCIRNKIAAGRSRSAVFLSHLIVCCFSCVLIYLVMLAVTIGMGVALFENNVTTAQLLSLAALGLLTCLAYACIYCTLTVLIGSRTNGVVICMIVSFALLFAALHTNQIVVQQPMKNGAPNPHYVSGVTRYTYEWMHDLNPTGQAAQLSSMDCRSPLRLIVSNVMWMILCIGIGGTGFAKKNIR